MLIQPAPNLFFKDLLSNQTILKVVDDKWINFIKFYFAWQTLSINMVKL